MKESLPTWDDLPLGTRLTKASSDVVLVKSDHWVVTPFPYDTKDFPPGSMAYKISNEVVHSKVYFHGRKNRKLVFKLRPPKPEDIVVVKEEYHQFDYDHPVEGKGKYLIKFKDLANGLTVIEYERLEDISK